MRQSTPFLRLRALLTRRRRATELEEELQAHIELETRKYISLGIPLQEAHRRANVALGSRVRVTEECRDQWGIRLLDNLARDVRDALRAFRRAPTFALAVVLTMAIAIGANTTVFSFCRAILLATLPVPNPQDLHLLSLQYPGSAVYPYFSFPDLQQMQSAVGMNARLTGFTQVVEFHVSDDAGTTSTIQGQLVTGDFFSTLQVTPLAGRPFTEEDNQPGVPPVAALSYRFWQDRFGGDQSALGREIRIQRVPVKIVAVMPEGFQGVDPAARPDLWMPLAVQGRTGYSGFASFSNVDWRTPWMLQNVTWLGVFARSPSGTRLEAILTQYIRNTVATQLPYVSDPKQREEMLGARIRIESAAGGLPRLREQFSLPLKMLFGLVAVLLCSGCLNLTNLLLARTRAHQHENALRISLGSSRGQLIAHQLTETLLLTGAGGLASVPLALWGVRIILSWLPLEQNLAIDFNPDWIVFAFIAAVSLLSGVLIALVPALRSFDQAASRSLGLRWHTSGQIEHLHRFPAFLFTSGQLALSMVSLVVAGLLTHTLVNYSRIDVGLDRGRVLSVRIDPLAAGYANPIRSAALYRQVTERINRIPGVVSSSVGGCGLMQGACAILPARVDGRSELRPKDALAERNYVGPQYMSTVGLELVRGREITSDDQFETPPVAVVNQAFEVRFLNGESALDQVVSLGGQKARIVGVVKDARSQDIHRVALPFVYLAVQQVPDGWNVSQLEVRTKADPLAATAAVRAAILEIDRAIPIAEMTTLSDSSNRGLVREILTGRLAGLFSLLTLMIAALGLYGVLAYEVNQRRGEIGIRMALGATNGAVVRMVFQRASAVWAVGCAAGLLVSVFVSRLFASLLFGTGDFDGWTYAGSLGALLIVSAAAVVMPAWRAACTDPASVLKAD